MMLESRDIFVMQGKCNSELHAAAVNAFRSNSAVLIFDCEFYVVGITMSSGGVITITLTR